MTPQQKAYRKALKDPRWQKKRLEMFAGTNGLPIVR